MRKQSKYLISIAVTVVTVGFLLSFIDPRRILAALATLKPRWVAAALAAYAVTYATRAVSFALLLPGRPVRARQIFGVHCIHNFYNMILPARAGELSYLYLMKKRHGIPAAQALSSLLVQRIIDLSTVPLFFIAGLLLWRPAGAAGASAHGARNLAAALGLTVALGALVAWLPALNDRFWNAAERLFARLRWDRYGPFKKIRALGRELSASMRSVGNPQNLFLVWCCAMLGRLANNLCLFFLIVAAAIPCGFFQSVVGSTGAVLTNVLPINGVGSFGPFEGGWAAGFMFVGLSRDAALSSGFIAHIMTFLFSLLLFLTAWPRVFGLGSASANIKFTTQNKPSGGEIDHV